jgi:hypothetical protein
VGEEEDLRGTVPVVVLPETLRERDGERERIIDLTKH